MPRELVGIFPVEDVASGARVEGRLYQNVTEENLCDIEVKWQAEFDERQKRAEALGLVDWRDEDDHWDWRERREERKDLLEKPGFVVEVNGLTEGMLYVDLSVTRVSRSAASAGKGLVYVDYIAAAPWNRDHPDGKPKRLRGVGRALMLATVQLSFSEEYEGLVGLHSLKRAESFYRNCGLMDFDCDRSCQNLRYFEMSSDGARAFLAAHGQKQPERR